jgi:hypothetical protein
MTDKIRREVRIRRYCRRHGVSVRRYKQDFARWLAQRERVLA